MTSISPLDFAVKKIINRLDKIILETAFLGNNPLLTLHHNIKEYIIENMMDEVNLISGEKLELSLSGHKLEYVKDREYTLTLLHKELKGREILRVLNITSIDNGANVYLPIDSTYLNSRNDIVSSTALQSARNASPYDIVNYSKIKIIGNNKLLINGEYRDITNSFITLEVVNDVEYSNMPKSLLIDWSYLCEAFIKEAVSKNKLVRELTNMRNGFKLDSYQTILNEYYDEGKEYKDLLKSWRKLINTNEDNYDGQFTNIY